MHPDELSLVFKKKKKKFVLTFLLSLFRVLALGWTVEIKIEHNLVFYILSWSSSEF